MMMLLTLVMISSWQILFLINNISETPSRRKSRSVAETSYFEYKFRTLSQSIGRAKYFHILDDWLTRQ
uniref:Secreted protein n=1 Tax=Parascaris univalens TaxID=6257 RepID=A0A915ASP2_PARUN